MVRKWSSIAAGATKLFEKLSKEVAWEKKPVIMYGKEIMQPRSVACCGNVTKHTYSGLTLDVSPYKDFPGGLEIEEICNSINKLAKTKYNSCLTATLTGASTSAITAIRRAKTL